MNTESKFKKSNVTEEAHYNTRAIYRDEQYLDINAKVINGEDFKINITSSQTYNFTLDMQREALQTLVDSIDELLQQTDK